MSKRRWRRPPAWLVAGTIAGVLVFGSALASGVVVLDSASHSFTVTTCQLDTNPAEICESPVHYEGLEPGPHRVIVRANTFRLGHNGAWRVSKTGRDEWSWVVLPRAP